mmetsp:Transcript_849/g.2206  ORF Transcript_849/g.2206 Transcript_849/m.2206 type:complete len:384 (-) Transcript_849:1143-2294(-)
MDVLLRDPQEPLQLLRLGGGLKVLVQLLLELVRCDDGLLVALDAVLLGPLHHAADGVAHDDDDRNVSDFRLLGQEHEVRELAVVLERLLDLLDRHVLPEARLEDVLLAVNDLQATSVGPCTDVAGLEPRPAVLDEEFLLRLARHLVGRHVLLEAVHRRVVVAGADTRTADPHLAARLRLSIREGLLRLCVLVDCRRAAVIVHLRHVHEAYGRGAERRAHIAGNGIEGHRQSTRRGGFRRAIALDHGREGALHKLERVLGDRGAARHAEADAAAQGFLRLGEDEHVPDGAVAAAGLQVRGLARQRGLEQCLLRPRHLPGNGIANVLVDLGHTGKQGRPHDAEVGEQVPGARRRKVDAAALEEHAQAAQALEDVRERQVAQVQVV